MEIGGVKSNLRTNIEIMNFIKKKIKVGVESEKQLLQGEPNFIMDVIYETCKKFKLVCKTSIYKRLERQYKDDMATENLSFMFKFLIVKEVLEKLFQFKGLTLIDYFQPKINTTKQIFTILMNFSDRVKYFKEKFKIKVTDIEALKENVNKTASNLRNLEDKYRRIENEKREEKPIYEDLLREIEDLNMAIAEAKVKKAECESAKKEATHSLKQIETEITKKTDEYENFIQKGDYLQTQIVDNYSDILLKNENLLQDIRITAAELRSIEDIIETHNTRLENLIKLKKNVDKSLDAQHVYDRKKKTYENFITKIKEQEEKLRSAKNALLQHQQGLKHLQQLHEQEKKNYEVYEQQYDEQKSTVDRENDDLKGKKEELDRYYKERKRELDHILNSIHDLQVLKDRIVRDQQKLIQRLDDLYHQLNLKFDMYKDYILNMTHK